MEGQAIMARFFGTAQGNDKTIRTAAGKESMNMSAKHADGDLDVSMFQSNTDKPANVSVVLRDHDTGSLSVALYNGPIKDLLKGGRLELMRYLIEGASKAEKAQILLLLVNRALAREFGNALDPNGKD